jgi:hypothetical protein
MFRKRSEPLPIVLYTRAGCHLCDDMKAEIARARLSRAGPRACVLTEVDIDGDPRLVEAYGRSIPVLEIGGRAAFKGRCTAEEIVRKVERALREREPA